MNSPETRDPIDKLLCEQDVHVADDGFTRRVLTVLPRRRGRWLPRIVLLSAIIGGMAMAILWMPWKSLPPLDFTQVFASDSKVFSAWIPVLAVGIVLGAAMRSLFRREN